MKQTLGYKNLTSLTQHKKNKSEVYLYIEHDINTVCHVVNQTLLLIDKKITLS